MERQFDSLHCTGLPSHSVESAEQFIKDIQDASISVKVIKQLYTRRVVFTYTVSQTIGYSRILRLSSSAEPQVLLHIAKEDSIITNRSNS